VAGGEDGACRRMGRRGQCHLAVFSSVSIASVQPVQIGGHAGRGQLPLLWAHGVNLQLAVDGQRYGAGAIRSRKARFRKETAFRVDYVLTSHKLVDYVEFINLLFFAGYLYVLT
jgi:hypothetical protein